MADKIKDGILGLGGAPVERDPLAPLPSSDDASVQRQRDRLHEGEDTERGGAAPRAGATGIDMGSGGEGTDLSGR